VIVELPKQGFLRRHCAYLWSLRGVQANSMTATDFDRLGLLHPLLCQDAIDRRLAETEPLPHL
jgi:hypothetical protein